MKKDRYPFAIYRHNRYHGRPGMWERCGRYTSPETALQALLDLTRKPKKKRVFVYVILQNTERERWLLTENHEQLLKSAR